MGVAPAEQNRRYIHAMEGGSSWHGMVGAGSNTNGGPSSSGYTANTHIERRHQRYYRD